MSFCDAVIDNVVEPFLSHHRPVVQFKILNGQVIAFSKRLDEGSFVSEETLQQFEK